MNAGDGWPGRVERVARAVGVLVLVAGMAAVHIASAQGTTGAAEVVRATGTVEVLAQGQPPWKPAAVGMQLLERDEVRALKGASAELRLPDTSTLLLAENSRIVLTRLHFDPKTRAREESIVHLAVGKVRAIVATAALTLVRARQSNFAISTPGAVAAARGTGWTEFLNPGGESGVPPPLHLMGVSDGEVTCISLGSLQAAVMFSGDIFQLNPQGRGSCIRFQMSAADRAVFFSLQNLSTEGHAALFNPVIVVDPDVVSGLWNPQARRPDGPFFTNNSFSSPRIQGSSPSPSLPQ